LWNPEWYENTKRGQMSPFAYCDNGTVWWITFMDSVLISGEELNRLEDQPDEPSVILIARNAELALNAARNLIDIIVGVELKLFTVYLPVSADGAGEDDFVQSMLNKTENSSLTEKQSVKLEQIWETHCRD
jgi:hypothetical protein